MSLLEKYSYRKYRKNKLFRHFISVIAVIISGFLQAFTLKVFIQTSKLLSSGFLGFEILINIRVIWCRVIHFDFINST